MTTELIEQPAQAIARHVPNDTFAVAVMSDADFERRLSTLKQGRERVQTIQREIMVVDVDYGTIPGTPKPTLYKSGAETLCVFHGLVARMEVTFRQGDGFAEPHLTYDSTCYLHLGSTDGPIVGTGHGTANSWERRYRYRRGERTCPDCGMVGTIIKGKAEYGGGWLCWRNKGGCGSKWADDASEIISQQVGDIENPDPWDLAVTLMKMAEKRAHVDATLRATGTSGLFTQDVEDGAPAPDDSPAQSGCQHPPAKHIATDEGIKCSACGDLVALRGDAPQARQRPTSGPRNKGEAQEALMAVARQRSPSKPHEWLEVQAKKHGIKRGEATLEQFMWLLRAIEQPASAGVDEVAARSRPSPEKPPGDGTGVPATPPPDGAADGQSVPPQSEAGEVPPGSPSAGDSSEVGDSESEAALQELSAGRVDPDSSPAAASSPLEVLLAKPTAETFLSYAEAELGIEHGSVIFSDLSDADLLQVSVSLAANTDLPALYKRLPGTVRSQLRGRGLAPSQKAKERPDAEQLKSGLEGDHA